MKRVSALCLCLTIVSMLFCFETAFAAYGRQGVYWFDRCYEDTYTIDMNFKKTSSGKSYGFEVTAPGDESNLQGFVKYTANAMFQFTQSDELAMRGYPGFITPEKENDTGLSKFAISNNEVHNLKLRFLTELNKVEYYLDGQKIHEAKGYSAVPCNGISFFSDSEDKDGLWWEIVSVTGNEENEISAPVTDFDKENKQITVSFSKGLTDYSLIANPVLKNVNGGEEISLTEVSKNGAYAVYSYTDELKDFGEYAVVFPYDAVDADGNVLRDKCSYFTPNGSLTKTQLGGVDYNDERANVWASSGIAIAEIDTEHGKSMTVKNGGTTGSDSSFRLDGFDFPDKDIASVKFELMPLHDDMQLAMRFMDKTKPNNVTPINLAFCKSGEIIAGKHWFDSSKTNVTSADASYKVGTYQKDTWYTFEIQYDRVNMVAKYFIDGELVKILDKSVMDGFSGIGKVTFAVQGSKWDVANGDAMFNFDNIYWYEITDNLSVKKLRATDVFGNEKGSFDEILRAVDKITVDFAGNVDKTTVNSENVKLFYGDSEIPYTGSYNETEKSYVMTPSKILEDTSKIYIKINGVTDGGEQTLSFETSLNGVKSSQNGVFVYKYRVEDQSGNEAKALTCGSTYNVALTADYNMEAEKVRFIVGYYSNLENGGYVLNSAELTDLMSMTKGLAVTNSEIAQFTVPQGTDMVKVFAWTDNYKPILNSCSLLTAE